MRAEMDMTSSVLREPSYAGILDAVPETRSRGSVLLLMRRSSKRTMDLLFAVLFLSAAWPMMVCVAILIKLTSSGMVFFRQDRVGLRGRIFKIFKFRTMFSRDTQQDHKAYIHMLLKEGEKSQNEELLSRYLTHVDSHVTSIGRFLRASSLDELPQFLNIVLGEMSLVGPRPHPVYEVQAYKPWYYRRLEVKPGLTGWSKINLRMTPENYEEAIGYDLWYVDNWGFWTDIKILLMTIPFVLFMKDAH